MMQNAGENIYMKLDTTYTLYRVKLSNLKKYVTLKSEAPTGHYRRPPEEFKVSDTDFEIGMQGDEEDYSEEDVNNKMKIKKDGLKPDLTKFQKFNIEDQKKLLEEEFFD